jgi:hypothetical protein
MFRSSSVTSPFESRRFAGIAVIATLVGALVLVTGGATRAFAADEFATVSGTLTSGGTALVGAEVDIESQDGEFSEPTDTGDDGAWSFTDVPAGEYTLAFAPSGETNLAPQWWNGQTSESAATYFTVTAGQTLIGMDAELAPGATIAGTVTGDDTPGVGVANVDVFVESADGSGDGQATTASDGSYFIDGLPAGDYSVQFQPEESPYIGEWWNNQPTAEDADLVTVAAGDTESAINASLARGATVSGTVDVAGSPAKPLADVRVSVITTDDSNSYDAHTDAEGHYAVVGVPSGTYLVEFRAPTAKKLAIQFWNDKTTFSTATHLPLTAGQDVTAVDATLHAGASISGTVYAPGSKKTGLAHERVSVFTGDGKQELENYAETNNSGRFTVSGLAAGTYKIGFTGPSTSKAAFEFWSGAFTLSRAKTITLKTGQAKTGINQKLVTGTKISGTIKGDRAHPKAVANVAVLLWASDQHPGTQVLPPLQVFTNSKGQYSFAHVGPGTYTLEFASENADYLSQWWKNAASQAKATKLVVKSTPRTRISGILALAVITAGTPTITGSAVVGSTLTAHPGTWKPSNIIFSYQWQRDGAAIAKATNLTYIPTSSDVGHALTVAVRGAIPGNEGEGKTEIVVSAATELVVAAG